MVVLGSVMFAVTTQQLVLTTHHLTFTTQISLGYFSVSWASLQWTAWYFTFCWSGPHVSVQLENYQDPNIIAAQGNTIF